MKKMTQRIKIYLITVLVLILVTGCGKSQYDENGFMGKTSDEIQSEYGNFDCIKGSSSSDGLYRNASCGYTVKEAEAGFLGKSDEEILFIRFDEEGFAFECYYGTRPGG